jgi:Domain of unknown function (DUF1839)
MTSPRAPRAAIWGLHPARYEPHRFHDPAAERIWPETNCYVDVWIELLWQAGLEPAAALGFTLAADFEGDQWTFFKFPHHDLQQLFGVDTQELALDLHILEQVQRKRLVLLEVDSFYLPDTAGTAYGTEHVKTTIGIQEIDIEEKHLGYFHNAGYFGLQGADFVGLFRQDDPWSPQSARLLPYAELARAHVSRRPQHNPFLAYKPRLATDSEWLRNASMSDFHLYAFATIRQFGACFELAADFCKWLATAGEPRLQDAAAPFEAIANEAKALQFKLARGVTLSRPLDLGPAVDSLAGHWDAAMAVLVPQLGA